MLGNSTSTKQDAVYSRSSDCTLWTLEEFSQVRSWVLWGNNRQQSTSLCRITHSPPHALCCFCSDLKQSGVVPWKAMELLDIVPEMLIACFSFFSLFIRLLVSLLLHSLYSFTMECNSLSCMHFSCFASGTPKVVAHFLDWIRSWAMVGSASSSP